MKLFYKMLLFNKDSIHIDRNAGAPHSSVVGSVGTEALQRTRVRLPARVPLLRVTPRLLPCFLSNSSAVLSNKARKGQKNTLKKKGMPGKKTSDVESMLHEP